MAFDPTPTTWIPSYSASGALITGMAPTELTSAEANATTGDCRQIYYALCCMMFDEYNSKAVVDRPTKMQVFKSIAVNAETGISTVNFNLSFNCNTGSMNVSGSGPTEA